MWFGFPDGWSFVTRATDIPWNREMSTMEAAGKLCFKPSAASSLSLWQIKPLFSTAWFSISDADSSQKETSGNLNLWWSKSEFDTLGGETGRALEELTHSQLTCLGSILHFFERSVVCFLVKLCTASNFAKESASYGERKQNNASLSFSLCHALLLFEAGRFSWLTSELRTCPLDP